MAGRALLLAGAFGAPDITSHDGSPHAGERSLVTNPAPEQSAFDDALSTLRVRFSESIGPTIAAFRAAADQLVRAPASPPVLAAIRRDLHRLSGTAGSFGFAEAGRVAASLLLVVERWDGELTRDLTRRAGIIRTFAGLLASAFGPRAGAGEGLLPGRLLLVDLEDDVAAPLISEALHRGRFVERVPAHQAQEIIDARAPDGVVSAAEVLLAVPPGCAHVLLRGPTQEPAAHGASAQVLDRRAGVGLIFEAVDAQIARAPSPGSTVLVAVGDDEASQAAVAEAARSHGMTAVPLAASEELAEALLARQAAALVLSAGHGRGDPAGVTRRLREDERFGELPVLLLTDDASEAARERAFAAGVDDVQLLPPVPLELARRLGRLVESRKFRRIARAIHPVSALALPERALREFDEGLRIGAADNQATTLAVVRPSVAPADRTRMAAWQQACMGLAATLAPAGVRAGFLDDVGLGLLLPFGAEEAEDRLRPFAEKAAAGEVPWRAGLAEQRPGADVVLAQMLRAGEEAWLIARDDQAVIHRWSQTDKGVAPDVVIIEDDAVLTDLISYAVSTRGLTSVAYADGPAALQGLLTMRTQRRQPVVLLDIDLPGLDGFSLFERVQLERPGSFRVAFMSVRSSEADQLRALRAGAIDFLPKPLSLRILFAKLAVWRGQSVAT